MELSIEQISPLLLHFNQLPQTPTNATRLTLLLLEALSDHSINAPFLKLLSRFLTKELYSDLISERNINKLCGYPLCSNQPARKQKANSNWESPNNYLTEFCSKEHYQASQFYRVQLSDEAIFSRTGILSESYGMKQYELGIVLLEEATDNKALMEVVGGLDNLAIDETAGVEKMLQDIKIIEKDVV